MKKSEKDKLTNQSKQLTNLNKSSIFISNVDLRLNILESFFGYPSFKYLKLKEVTTTLFQSTKSSDLRSDPFDLKEILEQQFTVDRLQFDGRITIPEITILKDKRSFRNKIRYDTCCCT